EGTASTATAETTVNISYAAFGGEDWIKWGESGGGSANGVTRKSGVNLIGDYALVSTSTQETATTVLRKVQWSGGAPVASGSNNVRGKKIIGDGKGMRFTVPADTAERKLTVQVFGWNSHGTLTASLSDDSQPDAVLATAGSGGHWTATFTIDYQAASAGQTLEVTWLSDGASWGNSGLQAASLVVTQPAPP